MLQCTMRTVKREVPHKADVFRVTEKEPESSREELEYRLTLFSFACFLGMHYRFFQKLMNSTVLGFMLELSLPSLHAVDYEDENQ